MLLVFRKVYFNRVHFPFFLFSTLQVDAFSIIRGIVEVCESGGPEVIGLNSTSDKHFFQYTLHRFLILRKLLNSCYFGVSKY